LRNRIPLRAATIAVSVATALSMAAPAMAHSKPAPVRVQKFSARGLVVSSTPTTLKVITREMKVGASAVPANTVVTVKRPAGKGKAKTTNLAGYAVTVTGNAVRLGKTTTLTASQETVAPRPAEVFLGEVTDVSGTQLTLEASSAAGGDDFGAEDGTLTVDISAATSTVDGASGTPAEGEFAVVLGEREDDTIAAASVDAWTDVPDVVAGGITDVSGSVVTLDDSWPGCSPGAPGDGSPGDDSPGDGNLRVRSHAADDPSDDQPGDDQPGDDQPGDDQPGDDQPGDDGPVTVDLAPGGTAVPVVLDGGETVDPGSLTSGNRLVVLGTTGDDGTFTAAVAFAFDEDNNRPANRHHRHGR
jgi:hypothetical protein